MAERGRRRLRRAALAGLLALLAAGAALLLAPAGPPPRVDGWMAAAGVEPAVVEVGGVRVRYVRAGHGSPVLLLHGFGSSVYTWSAVLPALAAAHDVVAIDLPPFGASDIPADLGPGLYERLIPGVLDALGLGRVAIVGNSLGGAVGITTAAKHPERVDRLVLIDAAGYNFAPADRPAFLRFLGLPFVAPVLEKLPVRRGVVRFALRQVLHDDAQVTPERVDEYLAPILRPGSLRAAHGLLQHQDEMGFPGIIRSVRQPTLVVWGREDAWIPLEHAGRFERDIPGARVHVLPGCGHVPQEECGPAVLAQVLPFLAPGSAGP